MKKPFLIVLLMFTSLMVNGQTISTFLKEGVTSFFIQEEDRWMSSQRIVLHRVGQKITGFAGWSAQGENPGYIEGELNGNSISGKWISFSGDEEPISISIALNSISTGWGFLTNEDGSPIKIPVETEDLFIGKNLTIYEQPDFTSKILIAELDAENKGFKIIEIGEMATDPEYDPGLNIWYKVKNNLFEGWVFGLIDSL